MTARRGTARGSHDSGSHSPERRNALAQWKKTVSISTSRARIGRLPRTAMASKYAASSTSRARPLIAQGVAAAGDEEVEADVRVGQHVAVAVDPPVARPLRDRDRALVDDVHELPGRVALGAGVAPALGVEVASTQNGVAASHARSMSVSTSAPW